MELFIGIVGTLLGFLFSYLAFQRNRGRDIKMDAKEDGMIKSKLDSIVKGIDEIRIDLKANEKQMIRMNEKIIRVDESTKSAHKRIDKMEMNEKK